MVIINLKPECINCKNANLEEQSFLDGIGEQNTVISCLHSCVCKDYLDSKRKPITEAGLMVIQGKAIGNYGEMCHEKM